MGVGSLQGESCFCGKASRGDTPHQDPATPALVLLDPKMQLSREGFVVTDQADGMKVTSCICSQSTTPRAKCPQGAARWPFPGMTLVLPSFPPSPTPPQQVVNLSWSLATRRWTHTGNHLCHRLQRRKGPSLGLVFSRLTQQLTTHAAFPSERNRCSPGHATQRASAGKATQQAPGISGARWPR